MPNETQDLEKQKAAELLLADAIRERDKYQALVDFLSHHYKTGGPTGGSPTGSNGTASEGSFNGWQRAAIDDEDDAGYGAIRKTVYRAMIDAGKRLTVSDLTARLVSQGFKTEARSPINSVRTAVRGLAKAGKVKKIGSHYRVIDTTLSGGGT